MKTDHFERYHPLVNFLYFVLVLGFAMALNHPISQGISLVCTCVYALQTQGRKALGFCLKWCLPMLLITAIVNPVFSHEGITVLFYFPSGNPLTLESILYGISAGTMLATVIVWFYHFSRVITSDKLIYLFGRVIPALSLVLSMTLRFIPRFKTQMAAVTEAQQAMGKSVSEGSLWQRAKNAITVLSIMITWSLENGIETADSMKSRGYGLKGRTAFSIYRLEGRDKAVLCFLLFCGFYLLCGAVAGVFSFRHFPALRRISVSTTSLSFHIVYFALCIMPVVLNTAEEKQWNIIHSKM